MSIDGRMVTLSEAVSRFEESLRLAEEVGVPSEEILDSLTAIDEFMSR